MEIYNIVSSIIGLVSSVISISLAIFAIWISKEMEKKSEESNKQTLEALNKIKEVSATIQGIVSEDHQKIIQAILRKVDKQTLTERRYQHLIEMLNKGMTPGDIERTIELVDKSVQNENAHNAQIDPISRFSPLLENALPHLLDAMNIKTPTITKK